MAPTNGVKLQLDKMRRLRYTNRSLVRLEEEIGLTVEQAGRRVEIGSLKALSALVWAGLLHDEPNLTVEKATEMIEPPLMPLINGLMEALDPWTVDPEEDEEGNGKAAG